MFLCDIGELPELFSQPKTPLLKTLLKLLIFTEINKKIHVNFLLIPIDKVLIGLKVKKKDINRENR